MRIEKVLARVAERRDTGRQIEQDTGIEYFHADRARESSMAFALAVYNSQRR